MLSKQANNNGGGNSGNNGNSETNKTATAVVSVVATGISVSELEVQLSETSYATGFVTNGQKKALSNDGKASFEVKKYIGKKLFFRVLVKATSEVEKTIAEGDNAISFSVEKKQPKATGVKVVVKKDGVALSGEVVYAIAKSQKDRLEMLIKYGQDTKSLRDVWTMKATTDTNGVASFTNLIGLETFFGIFKDNKYHWIETTVEKDVVKTVELKVK